MNPDGDRLEQRLARRTAPTLPPELRGRVLASVDRALDQVGTSPNFFLNYVLPTAAAVLICANLFLGLFVDAGRSARKPPMVNPEASPASILTYLPSGASKLEFEQLSFVLRVSGGAPRPPALSAPVLRNLLHEESASWNTR